MVHALMALMFVVVFITPCVIASRIDLDAEEANANQWEMDSRFSSRD